MVLSLVLGLAVLVAGAEVIVRFGTRLAERLGISPIVIGLTVVSIGTSAPELAVGIDAMRRGAGSLVIGNIAGTNLVNILLIMGLSAAIRPILIRDQTMRLDLPAMVTSAVLLLVLSLDGYVSTWDGVALLAVGVGYMVTLFLQSARYSQEHSSLEPDSVQAAHLAEHPDDELDSGHDPSQPGDVPAPRSGRAVALDLVMLVAGIAVVVVGADWLVDGAVGIAEHLGLSQALIGLTVVAIGTSAPELVTTLVSTIRGQRAIAIGNLLGSSTLNLTLILGGSLLFGPTQVPVDPYLVRINVPLMVAAVLVCIPVFLTGRRMTRWEGGLFVAAYVAYLTALVATRG